MDYFVFPKQQQHLFIYSFIIITLLIICLLLLPRYWLRLFPIAWAVLSVQQRQLVLTDLSTFLSNQTIHHSFQAYPFEFYQSIQQVNYSKTSHQSILFSSSSSCTSHTFYPNLPSLLLEGCLRCIPIPILPIPTYLQLVEQFGCSQVVICTLLQQVRQTRDVEKRGQIGQVLLRIAESVHDDELRIGIMKTIFTSSSSSLSSGLQLVTACYHERNGQWRQALQLYNESLVISSSTNSPTLENELEGWIDSRVIECQKNLRQWKGVLEKAERLEDTTLMMECYTHLNDWKYVLTI